MLTHDRMVQLYRELQDTPVLSVYIDGNQHDPAERNKWRTELERGLDQTRRQLSSEEDLAAFDAAARRIQGQLKEYEAFLPDKAFVAFGTADKLWYGQTVSVSMPNLVRWDMGIAVAPYVRGLKQERPVVVAIADSQRARIFLYRDGGILEVDDLRADTFVGDLTDSGVSKRATTISGTVGETSTDQGQRFLEVASERMVKELIQVVSKRAGDHGFVVLGGTHEMETWIQDALPKSLDARVIIDASLHVEMREAELRRAVGNAASELTKRWQMGIVQLLFDQARAGGRATIGYAETEQALEQMRVDTLLLSRTRTREQDEDSDRLIGLAFEGAAHVEEVSGAAGDLLDLESEGIASRLRFRLQEPQSGHPEEMEAPEAQAKRARREVARRRGDRLAAGD
jgi:hypothetical protein